MSDDIRPPRIYTVGKDGMPEAGIDVILESGQMVTKVESSLWVDYSGPIKAKPIDRYMYLDDVMALFGNP